MLNLGGGTGVAWPRDLRLCSKQKRLGESLKQRGGREVTPGVQG